MKKLLITGASGFLGNRIADFYAKTCEIIAPAHRELDITDKDNTALVLKKYRPDVVIHCAAMSDVGMCEKAPKQSWNINVTGSINLAKAAGAVNAKCILCSSDQVYFSGLKSHRNPEHCPTHREDEKLCPGNLYGQEKLKAEQECLNLNPDCVLLRLSWMYDAKTKRKDEHGDFFRTLLPQIAGAEMIKFPIYDRRGITDVHEVVQNLEKTFELPGGVYNFGSPNEKNTYGTVRQVFANTGLDTGRLGKNEEAFCENSRNLAMCQDKINQNGIFFSHTAEGLSQNLAWALKNGSANSKTLFH